jgi:uncharacterized membrane protein (DUF4010 family)
MSFEDIFLGFLIALAAGALIGLEREQSRLPGKKPSLGGVRTFPLLALSGALSALLAHTMGVWPILGALLVVGAFLTVVRLQDLADDTAHGITTEVAALITFLLGVLALLPGLPLVTGQRYLLIIASAGVVMALLSFKRPLHEAVKRVSDDDLYATAKFLILVLVILPLLPDRTMGPLNVLNPFNVGLMIVLVASISFLGYLATRVAGERRGLTVTGILGGLASSTAVTVDLAGRVRDGTYPLPLAATTILAASATMCMRTLAVVGIVDSRLVPSLVLPVGAMMLAGYGVSLALYVRSVRKAHEAGPIAHRNPFALLVAMEFGLVYAVILFVTKAAQVLFGDVGIYLSSILAGLHDVDAIALSITRLHSEGLAQGPAAAAITLAVMTNTLVKAGLAAWLGGRDLGLRVAMGAGAMLAAAGLILIMVRA